MLPKAKKMTSKEVTSLFSQAKTLKNELFLLKFSKNDQNRPLFAVAPSKKVFPTAVERNKARRRIYSAVAKSGMDTINFSFVFIPNREALQAPYTTLVEVMKNVCTKLRT